jgi:phosphoribosyl-AMP cyclohydrolase/phosphoribosyl-ATP pyrophosphohydrolase/phosphoribosyl-AMP cyclohydrolase
MYDIKKLFEKGGLVPAIVRDEQTKDVLMLAYMNEESLRKTLATGYTWFYSRSRGQLWQKGETSGNVQRVVSIVPDCDDDTLLVTVRQTGVACHTGNWSCFFAEPITGEQLAEGPGPSSGNEGTEAPITGNGNAATKAQVIGGTNDE